MEKLFSPWRLRYIRAAGRVMDPACVFCRAVRASNDRKHLVLARGRLNYIILNKYPYNNAHMMIVPYAHVPALRDVPLEGLAEMMDLAVRCEAALKIAYRPTGVNLGMNLGRSAGAGIEKHIHLHVVPRWDGDTNFMSVVHGTRVIPESLQTTYRRLRALLQPGVADARGIPSARRPGRRRPSRARA